MTQTQQSGQNSKAALQDRGTAVATSCAVLDAPTRPQGSPGVRVHILDNWASIAKVSEVWRAWQQNPNADMDFVRFIIAIRDECERPYVACVEDDTGIRNLLIGRVETIDMPLTIGYLTLLRLPIRLIDFVHGGLLGELAPAEADELVKALISRLGSGEADAIFFGHLPQESALAASIKTIPGVFSRDGFASAQVHRSMAIPESVDEFYARLSGKVRRNQRWQAKKMLETFSHKVEIRSFTAPHDLDTMFRDVNQIAKTTYQRALGVGFSDTPEMRGRTKLAAANGWLQTFVLYLADKPAAFWMGTRYRNRFFSNCMGYDATYAKHSPGMYLIMNAIESFCNQRGPNRVREIDFGLGDAQYKEILATHSWTEESLHIYSSGLRGLALNCSKTLTSIINSGAKRILGSLGLQHRLKTAWRRRLARR